MTRTSPPRSRTPRLARSSSASTRPASSTAPSVAARSSAEQLQGNLAALLDALNKAKPASSKGVYLRKVAVLVHPWAWVSAWSRFHRGLIAS